MFINSRNWPAWVFFLTLSAAVASTAFSINYVSYVSTLQSQKDELSKLTEQYHVTNMAAIADIKGKKFRVPTLTQSCGRLTQLGSQGCAGVKEEVYQLYEPSVLDAGMRQKVDEDIARIKTLAQANTATGEKVAYLQSIHDFIQGIMKPIVSLLVLCASLFVILSNNYRAEAEKWAFGSLGTVLGVWLK